MGMEEWDAAGKGLQHHTSRAGLQSSSKSTSPPPTSLLSPRLRVPGVSPETHSPCEAMCAQMWGLQIKSLPREETAAVAAETQPKALVWGQFQHQDGQDFKRRTCIYYGMKHNARKRNP